MHSGMILQDPTGAQKSWSFYCTNPNGYTNCPSAQLAPSQFTAEIELVSELQETALGASSPMRDTTYQWTPDSAGNAYLSQVKTTLDEGQPWAQATTSTQTLDTYGNVLTLAVSDYNGTTRSYTNTYSSTLTGGYCGPVQQSFNSVCNRLLKSTLTSGGNSVTLVTNYYDTLAMVTPTGGVPREKDTTPRPYAAHGNLTQSLTPGHTVNTQYYATGTVSSQNDGNNHSVSVATGPATNFTLPEQLTPNSSALLSTNALYLTASLSPTSVAPPYQSVFQPNSKYSSGTASYTTYDLYGRVSAVYPPTGYQNSTGTYYQYTYGSPWTIAATTQVMSGSSPNYYWKSSVRTQTLDGLGRAVSVSTTAAEAPPNDSQTPVSEVDTTYAPCACSPFGKMSSRTQPYPPGQANPPVTTYQYDALGRTIKITLPDGSITQYLYQGNVTTVTDPAGNWKQYTNDAFGNLVTVLEPDPAHPGTLPPVPTSQYPLTAAPAGSNTLFTGYSYDALNHLLQVNMPRSTGTQTRTFAYDSSQRLKTAINPENGTVAYAYNQDSTLSTKTYNNHNYELYNYDTFQRLTAIHRFVCNSTCTTATEDLNQLQSFTYDTTPSGATYYGLLTTATFASGLGSTNNWTLQNQYTYNVAGQVATKALSVSKTNPTASGLLTTTYGYDGLGTLTSIQYPSPSPLTLTYALDGLERPVGLTDNTNYHLGQLCTIQPGQPDHQRHLPLRQRDLDVQHPTAVDAAHDHPHRRWEQAGQHDLQLRQSHDRHEQRPDRQQYRRGDRRNDRVSIRQPEAADQRHQHAAAAREPAALVGRLRLRWLRQPDRHERQRVAKLQPSD